MLAVMDELIFLLLLEEHTAQFSSVAAVKVQI